MWLYRLIKQNKAFTLAEVLVSMAIFGILVIAFLSLFSSAYYMTLRAGDRDKTVNGISGKVENKIASSSYTDPQITQSTATVTLTYGNGATATFTVDQTTGTASMTDGTGVVIEYYKPAAVSP